MLFKQLGVVVTMTLLVVAFAWRRVESAREMVPVNEAPLVTAGDIALMTEPSLDTIGSSQARLTIVEFSDFQCPFCRRLASTLDTVRKLHGDSLRILFRHFPLGKHEQAFDAAVVAACAGQQGKFVEMHNTLFNRQRDLGKRQWMEWAEKAGVRDTERLSACQHSDVIQSRVRAEIMRGEKLGIRVTPTVFIAGRRFEGAPSARFIDSLVRNSTRFP